MCDFMHLITHSFQPPHIACGTHAFSISVMLAYCLHESSYSHANLTLSEISDHFDKFIAASRSENSRKRKQRLSNYSSKQSNAFHGFTSANPENK